MENSITASFETLLSDSISVTSHHLKKANEQIDEVYGKGYAKEHPELIGNFIKAAAINLQGSLITQAISQCKQDYD